MTREEALQKVQKLLRLSKSDNEGEAQAALSAAQRLMLQHNLTSSEVKAEESEKSGVTYYQVPHSTKTPSPIITLLLAAICKHYRCIVGLCGTSLQIIGEAQDVEFFKAIADYAISVQEKLSKEYLKKQNTLNRSESLKIKKAYCKGFRTGLVTALKDNENKYALAPIVPDAVAEIVKESFGSTKVYRQTISHDVMHLAAGFRDGKEALSHKGRLTAS